jgi:hypothetical protein
LMPVDVGELKIFDALFINVPLWNVFKEFP